MKRKIVIKTFLISLFAVILVFTASIATIYIVSQKSVKERLVADAQIYSGLIKEGYERLNDVKDFDKTRVTVIDMNGRVLFDSLWEGEISTNHIDREEVSSAIEGNPTLVKRYSETFGSDMYYYALKTDGDTPYIVRVAQQAANIWIYVGYGVPFVVVAMLVALIASFLFALKVSDNVEEQMGGIRDGLSLIKDGTYVPTSQQIKDTDRFAIIREMDALCESVNKNYNELNEEKAKLRYLIDHIRQGVVVLDSQAEITLINDVARDIFGDVKEGQALIMLLDDQTLYARVKYLLNAKKSERFTYSYKSMDLVIDVASVDNDMISEDATCIILISDVTAETSASRQKTTFFLNASHELKTPLTSIRGASELALSKISEDSPEKKYVERILKESKRLGQIVMDMLYISKLENSENTKGEIREEINIHAVIEEIISDYNREIEEKNLSVTLNGQGKIKADIKNIYACLGNVIGNAVHYNVQDGSIEISLEKGDNALIISVKDSGIGVSAQHIPHLTERFYRVDKSRSSKTGGTGLGLAIVKHVVALYSGALDIQSQEGVGTTVTLRFPNNIG